MSKLNVSLTTLVDFYKIFITLSVFEKTNPESNEYDKVLMRTNLDLCGLPRGGLFGNFFIENIAQKLEQYSNLKFECPLKKGFYYDVNYPIISDRLLPPHMFGLFKDFKCEIVIKGKVQGKQSTQRVTINLFIFRAA